METVPGDRVSSYRLGASGIELRTTGFQDEWFIHYTTMAPLILRISFTKPRWPSRRRQALRSRFLRKPNHGRTFINTVNCKVSNHFYFKVDSKYLFRRNETLALLLQSTIISLNNETQFVLFGLCFELYNDFEVDRQLAWFRVIFPVSNHFCNS